MWEFSRENDKRNIIGRVEMINEIKRLRRTLKKTNYSTRRVIKQCVRASPGVNFLKTNIWKRMPGLISDMYVDTMFDYIFSMIINACDEVINCGGPVIDGKSAIETYIKKAGRPENLANLDFVGQLGRCYYTATKKEPSESPSGPFADFLTAVFNATDPYSKRINFRKLIHASPGIQADKHLRRRRESLILQ